MQALFNIINIPFGWVLEFLSGIFGGNFAAAVFAFTLIINLILIPLSIKSQKSSVQQMRIKPKLDATISRNTARLCKSCIRKRTYPCQAAACL